jgi:hypothetical protein
MQKSRETYLLKEFYSRHKSNIDALGKDFMNASGGEKDGRESSRAAE